MAADYLSIREKVFERFPLMRSSAFERRMLFERSGDRNSQVTNLPEFPFERATMVPRV
jgi:hypothetical protein